MYVPNGLIFREKFVAAKLIGSNLLVSSYERKFIFSVWIQKIYISVISYARPNPFCLFRHFFDSFPVLNNSILFHGSLKKVIVFLLEIYAIIKVLGRNGVFKIFFGLWVTTITKVVLICANLNSGQLLSKPCKNMTSL